MLLAGVIGISLASYLKLSITSLRAANRSFYANSSVDYAEIGIERAMACFYSVSGGTAAANAWTGWGLDTTTKVATRTFLSSSSSTTYPNPGPNITAAIRVYVRGYDFTGTPIIVSKASITPSTPTDGPAINKFVKVTLRPRSLFANGLVSRNTISWTGNPSADSWNSDPDNDTTTAAVAYSTAAGVRAANCTIGCVATANGAIDLATGKVYGSVASGGGTVSGGSVISNSLTGTGIDPNCVSTDFSASFPTVATPTPTTVNTATDVSGTMTYPSLPAGGTAMNASDNTYYYNFGLGTNIDINGGGKNIQITAGNKVVFIMNNHSGVPAIDIGGNAYLTVNAGASLTIYTNGNLTMAGNGVVNSNVQPSSCLIYGTRTTAGQTITVSGNGQLKAAVYAPNATVTANGGGSSGQIQGSIVANSIVMHGGADFHYDEALRNLSAGAGVGVTEWRELQTATERNQYSTELDF
ncbi:MAG: hypothetical protein HY736_13890 [Verrucomicrobia bacterium]|nr:hypothetical protein [Verrucomicrobiota bacterium]